MNNSWKEQVQNRFPRNTHNAILNPYDKSIKAGVLYENHTLIFCDKNDTVENFSKVYTAAKDKEKIIDIFLFIEGKAIREEMCNAFFDYYDLLDSYFVQKGFTELTGLENCNFYLVWLDEEERILINTVEDAGFFIENNFSCAHITHGTYIDDYYDFSIDEESNSLLTKLTLTRLKEPKAAEFEDFILKNEPFKLKIDGVRGYSKEHYVCSETQKYGINLSKCSECPFCIGIKEGIENGIGSAIFCKYDVKDTNITKENPRDFLRYNAIQGSIESRNKTKPNELKSQNFKFNSHKQTKKEKNMNNQLIDLIKLLKAQEMTSALNKVIKNQIELQNILKDIEAEFQGRVLDAMANREYDKLSQYQAIFAGLTEYSKNVDSLKNLAESENIEEFTDKMSLLELKLTDDLSYKLPVKIKIEKDEIYIGKRTWREVIEKLFDNLSTRNSTLFMEYIEAINKMNIIGCKFYTEAERQKALNEDTYVMYLPAVKYYCAIKGKAEDLSRFAQRLLKLYKLENSFIVYCLDRKKK